MQKGHQVIIPHEPRHQRGSEYQIANYLFLFQTNNSISDLISLYEYMKGKGLIESYDLLVLTRFLAIEGVKINHAIAMYYHATRLLESYQFIGSKNDGEDFVQRRVDCCLHFEAKYWFEKAKQMGMNEADVELRHIAKFIGDYKSELLDQTGLPGLRNLADCLFKPEFDPNLKFVAKTNLLKTLEDHLDLLEKFTVVEHWECLYLDLVKKFKETRNPEVANLLPYFMTGETFVRYFPILVRTRHPAFLSQAAHFFGRAKQRESYAFERHQFFILKYLERKKQDNPSTWGILSIYYYDFDAQSAPAGMLRQDPISCNRIYNTLMYYFGLDSMGDVDPEQVPLTSEYLDYKRHQLGQCATPDEKRALIKRMWDDKNDFFSCTITCCAEFDVGDQIAIFLDRIDKSKGQQSGTHHALGFRFLSAREYSKALYAFNRCKGSYMSKEYISAIKLLIPDAGEGEEVTYKKMSDAESQMFFEKFLAQDSDMESDT